MRRSMALIVSVGLFGCSNSSSSEGADAASEASADATSSDGSGGNDSSSVDTGAADAGSDASDASDASSSSDASDAATEASTCPASWLVPPSFDPSLDVPEGGVVLLHAAGVGSQVYACVPNDAGASWILQGPDAVLDDCTGSPIGKHFPSEAGSAYPEWMTTDGTYVVGHKLVGFVPDGGAASVPWLLLQAVDAGGAGTLSHVTYIQRLDTDGGQLSGACDAGGTTEKVSYTADYFFYGP